MADRGRLFLDEIGELTLTLQVKLLRFLQDEPSSGSAGAAPITVDLRVIAATNRDLKTQLDRGLFREDLYYPLSVIRIQVPPLRERGEDIALLGNAFLRRAAQTHRRRVRFSGEALRALMAHRWPGNVRELDNRVSRAVIMARGDLIEPADLDLQATPISTWWPRPGGAGRELGGEARRTPGHVLAATRACAARGGFPIADSRTARSSSRSWGTSRRDPDRGGSQCLRDQRPGPGDRNLAAPWFRGARVCPVGGRSHPHPPSHQRRAPAGTIASRPGAAPALLRFLQERTVERIGGRQTIPLELRVIAVTNRDLKAQLSRGLFREDLYYRLSVIRIQVPPCASGGRTSPSSPMPSCAGPPRRTGDGCDSAGTPCARS